MNYFARLPNNCGESFFTDTSINVWTNAPPIHNTKNIIPSISASLFKAAPDRQP